MNLAKLEELRLKEDSAGFREMKTGIEIKKSGVSMGPPKERFSLLKAIRCQIENRPMEDVIKDVNTLGRQEFRSSGITTEGAIVLPHEIRTDILAGTTTQGAEIVATEKTAILPPLTDKLVFAQAGAKFLTGLVGDVSIPNYAGTSVGWKGEVESADDGGGAFADVELKPKRLTARLDVSKRFLIQDSVGAEKMLLDNIATAVATELQKTILGVLIGTTDRPQGMGYAITTGSDTAAASVVPTWAIMVAMESEIDAVNALQENLAYITNSGGRGILKTIPKGSSSDDIMLCEDNKVNGYPLLVTNGCSAIAGSDDTGDLIVFGNWKDLVIAQWGGYDITVDPYSMAGDGQVRLVINAYFDAKGLRGSAATDVHGESTTQENHYAVSFTTRALKAS
jgi:HK97 family phage major capsid protein